MSELQPGYVGEWEVVEHHPWGVQVRLVEDPQTRAAIDLPYLRDLGPNDRIDGPDDFPPRGDKLRAKVRVRWPDGTLHLTARESDMHDED